MQPSWRLAADSSFIYTMPADEEWCLLHKGGSAGLYTVIVALSWWIRVLPQADSSIRAWTAVHDVCWVINQISKKIMPASQGNKRGCKDATQSRKSKRFVSVSCTLFSIYANVFLADAAPGRLFGTSSPHIQCIITTLNTKYSLPLPCLLLPHDSQTEYKSRS
jgi:hypothetical protein